MITTLTGKNQITIPAALSAKLKLKPGTRLEWMAADAPDEIRCRIILNGKMESVHRAAFTTDYTDFN